MIEIKISANSAMDAANALHDGAIARRKDAERADIQKIHHENGGRHERAHQLRRRRDVMRDIAARYDAAESEIRDALRR